MLRFLRTPSTLKWHFALRYAIITTLILLIIEIVIIIISAWQVWRGPYQFDMFAEKVASDIQNELDQYIGTTSLSAEQVADWFAALNSSQAPPVIQPFVSEIQLDMKSLPYIDGTLCVLNRQQQILESLGTCPIDLPEFASYIAAINQGERDINKLHVYREGEFLFAYPIVQDSQLTGMILMVYPFTFGIVDGYDIWLSVLMISGAVFGVGSLLSGVIFGFLVARPLTRRLKHVADVTHSWANGDFSAQIKDLHNDEIHRLGDDLNGMAEQLKLLVQTQQELSVLNERNRMARDLHDSVKQQLFAISVNLGTVQALWHEKPAMAQERLAITMEIARQSQTEVQTIITTLRPPLLISQGLQEALVEYLQQWSQRTRIKTQAQFDSIQLSEHQEVLLFRMIQEILANVEKHSAAQHVHVTLTTHQDTVQLDVADDGQGFDQASVVHGIGLDSLQERVHLLKGVLEIKSDQHGTQVYIQFPL